MSKSGRRDAIIFDLDGTLVDSLPDLKWALDRTLEEIGRDAVDDADVKGWVGDGIAVLVARALAATGGVPATPPASALVERFRQFYGGHAVQGSSLYPGVLDALAVLKAAGYRLGVCTNKPYALSMEVLEGMGIAQYFDAVMGGDSVPARKPDPGHVKATQAALGGGKAIMVGDSVNDVASARAAGIPVVVVSSGYGRIQPHDLGADVVIDGFAALPAVVSRYFDEG